MIDFLFVCLLVWLIVFLFAFYLIWSKEGILRWKVKKYDNELDK